SSSSKYRKPRLVGRCYSLERLNAPEFFIWNKTKPHWRSGPWNGQKFIGLPSGLVYTSSYLNGFDIAREDNGSLVEIKYTLINSSYFATLVLTYEGKMVHTLWFNGYPVTKGLMDLMMEYNA
ncbi:S-locus-specific glycoprotein S6, partial [Trifolium pratense]